MLKSIQYSSQDFSHFHVVCSSLAPLKSLQMVPTTPCTPPGSFYPLFSPPLLLLLSWSPLLTLIPLYQHQTVDLVLTFKDSLTVCFQLPCHRLIPLFSVYSGIWVRKYILGWLILPHLISAAGWWFPAVLCGIFVWRAIFENKLCRWYKSDG